MTWRSSEELQQRVRRAAQAHGRSMNDYVSAVLDAATDPELAESDAARLRERLDRAGLLVASSGRTATRPPADEVAEARTAAGAGTTLSGLVSDGR